MAPSVKNTISQLYQFPARTQYLKETKNLTKPILILEITKSLHPMTGTTSTSLLKGYIPQSNIKALINQKVKLLNRAEWTRNRLTTQIQTTYLANTASPALLDMFLRQKGS